MEATDAGQEGLRAGERRMSNEIEEAADMEARMATEEDSPRYLDTKRAGAYTSLGKSTLEKLRLTGGGPLYLKVARKVLYDRADLDTWMASKKRQSTTKGER